VKIAKRSSEYRQHRHALSGPAPEDVWLDGDSGTFCVLFHMPINRPGEYFLAFAVEPSSNGVISAGVVSLEQSTEGYRGHHHMEVPA
jgi:hypothetical protein